jgi:hypothetical protein
MAINLALERWVVHTLNKKSICGLPKKIHLIDVNKIGVDGRARLRPNRVVRVICAVRVSPDGLLRRRSGSPFLRAALPKAAIIDEQRAGG